MFQLQPPARIGQIRTFYPFDKKDTLKRDIEVVGIENDGWVILYKIVGQTGILKMSVVDFFELYIDKEFYERWK